MSGAGQRRRMRGFTLIELLVSAVILGLLATIAVPFVETTVKRKKEQELRSALREIRNAIDAYKLAAEEGRIEVVPEESGYPHDLTVLVSGVPDISKTAKPLQFFLRRIPRDPFHPDPTVPAAETWGLRSYDSTEENPQPGDDVFDVYTTSTRTGLNSVPYREW